MASLVDASVVKEARVIRTRPSFDDKAKHSFSFVKRADPFEDECTISFFFVFRLVFGMKEDEDDEDAADSVDDEIINFGIRLVVALVVAVVPNKPLDT